MTAPTAAFRGSNPRPSRSKRGGAPLAAVKAPGRRTASSKTAAPKTAPSGPAKKPAPWRAPRSGTYLTLLGTIAVMNAIGVVMVLSASSVVSITNYGSAWYFFERQLVWTVLGVAAFLLVARVDYRRWRHFVRPLLIATVVMLVLVLIPGFGVYVAGSRRWLGFGSWRFQPSELAEARAAALHRRPPHPTPGRARGLAPGSAARPAGGGLRGRPRHARARPRLDAAAGPHRRRRARRRRDPGAPPAGDRRERSGAGGRSSPSPRRTGGPVSSPSCTPRPTPATPATRSCSR